MPVPVDLRSVLLTALLNPLVVIVAFWMGAMADQWQKLPLAAFAGAVAGMAVVYVAIRLGVAGVAGTSRAAAGVSATSPRGTGTPNSRNRALA